MTDVQVGDRVSCTTEGLVTRVDDGGIIWLDYQVGIDPSAPGWQTEIIEKRQPQVGDIIEGQASYDELPVGSVVKDSYQVSLKVSGNYWIAARYPGMKCLKMTEPRLLVYLP